MRHGVNHIVHADADTEREREPQPPRERRRDVAHIDDTQIPTGRHTGPDQEERRVQIDQIWKVAVLAAPAMAVKFSRSLTHQT